MYCNLPSILCSLQLTKVLKILHRVPESPYNDKGIVHHRQRTSPCGYIKHASLLQPMNTNRPQLFLSVMVRKDESFFSDKQKVHPCSEANEHLWEERIRSDPFYLTSQGGL